MIWDKKGLWPTSRIITTTNKVLIANRSEIALRIQASCHAKGIQTIAVYAPEDANLSYPYRSSKAYALSGQGFNAYTHQEEIIAIAHRAGVDGIHPGYGFLSENDQFAQRVCDEGFIWIGPHPKHIRLMGDKAQARILMQDHAIPVIPGSSAQCLGTTDGFNQAQNIARSIGFPIILKDPLSGGGKAMRRVNTQQDFESAWYAVVRESQQLTQSPELLIEKYLEDVRHIEVQIAGDGKNAVHFYERECSIQRRHQKIIEETPCQFVNQSILDRTYEYALQIVHAIGYDSIGTIEFLVTSDGQIYFLEMNTRLQVEHSITEMTTGIDLVSLQLTLATTKQLPIQQSDISRNGNAIECRIYAEDPSNNFMPSTGTIHYLQFPTHPFMRLDHDLAQGQDVTPFFDPMIGKISVIGSNRETAHLAMRDVLSGCLIDGITTNIDFLQAILNEPFFIQGTFSTQTLSDLNLLDKLAGADQDNHAEIDYDLAAIAMVIGQELKKEDKDSRSTQKTSSINNKWKQQRWQ